MYTVSIIIRQQPELTSRLKEETNSFIKSLVSLYGDMEFLFSEKGEYEMYLLAAVDKVRKGKTDPEQNVVVTLVSDEPLAECCWDGIFFDRVQFFSCPEGEEPFLNFSPMHIYMVERADFFLYYADKCNKDFEDLVRYVWLTKSLPLNLADYDDPNYIYHKEIF